MSENRRQVATKTIKVQYIWKILEKNVTQISIVVMVFPLKQNIDMTLQIGNNKWKQLYQKYTIKKKKEEYVLKQILKWLFYVLNLICYTHISCDRTKQNIFIPNIHGNIL